jgi:L-threonylcarbamoyladenylate synthase
MEKSFDKDIEKCLEVLREGGVILYPTDTIWGIGCDATNPAAVERIYRIKKRPDEKAMIVLVAEEKDILQYVAAPDLAVFDYIKASPRPTTVIYEGAIGLADNLIASDGSIAIRICQEIFCRHLIRRFRKPLVSTSANISGVKAPATFAEIAEEIKQQVDYTVSYRQSDETTATPSTIIKWSGGSPIVIRP